MGAGRGVPARGARAEGPGQGSVRDGPARHPAQGVRAARPGGGEGARHVDQMQADLFHKAKKFRDEHTFEVDSYQEMKEKADDGFLLAHWCEGTACEARAKQELLLTTRNRPFDLKQSPGKCVVCGNDSPGRVVFSKAY